MFAVDKVAFTSTSEVFFSASYEYLTISWNFLLQFLPIVWFGVWCPQFRHWSSPAFPLHRFSTFSNLSLSDVENNSFEHLLLTRQTLCHLKILRFHVFTYHMIMGYSLGYKGLVLKPRSTCAWLCDRISNIENTFLNLLNWLFGTIYLHRKTSKRSSSFLKLRSSSLFFLTIVETNQEYSIFASSAMDGTIFL